LEIVYSAFAPELVVTATLMVVLLGDLVFRGQARAWNGRIALLGVLAALGLAVAALGEPAVSTLGGFFVRDGFATVVKVIFLAGTAYVIWTASPPMRGHRYEGEFVFLVLCSLLGAMLMPSARDLLMLFVALELVSAPGFVMAGLRKRNPRSNEAALKFFIFGVIAAALYIYGMSLVYGVAGSTDLAEIASAVTAVAATDARPMLLTGLIFIVGAFGFKVSAVPFHFWAPDTYEGSPTPLASFLSVISKGAGFVGLLVILLIGFPDLSSFWGPFVGGLAIATMVVGNVVALRQRQLIRLLAYSSIGHAGYMLIPIAIIGPHGGVLEGANQQLVRSLVIYIAVYAVMNLGAFAVAIGLSKQYPTLLIRDLNGMSRTAPVAAFALATFMISLGGIPPFAGWFAKFAIFTAAVDAGSQLGLVLAVVMVLTSVVSLVYYVGVVRAMYLEEPATEEAMRVPRPLVVAAAVASVAVVLGGLVFPELFARLGDAAKLVLG
jgi:NADH-quinone oxidoreductase subunit N